MNATSENERQTLLSELAAQEKLACDFGSSARLALADATPKLMEVLEEHWSTGQGTRVRSLIWSLYNGSGLVQLGYTCSGLDPELGEAVAAAIRARLALGPDVEPILKEILENSGEMARMNAATDATPADQAILYPGPPASARSLRELADSVERQASA